MAIQLEDVSLRYRLARQRIPSLKEYAIHWLKGRLTYDDLWALSDMNLHVRPGEALGIVGRNGAGKSSLLKVISGILKPTRGRLRVDGRISPLLELGTGFDPELTGLENIVLNAVLLGRTRREVAAKVDDIVAFAELEDFIRSPIRNYSTGMLARLGFAIATAWDSEILIVDEVLSVGDQAFQQKSAACLQRAREVGTTVLLVSHSLQAIESYCTRCIWIDRGHLLADGTPGEVLALYLSSVAPAPAAAASRPLTAV